MTKLREALLRARQEQLLTAITLAIHGYTISARDPELSDGARAFINNQIHYLAGHLLGLIDEKQLLGPSRAEAIEGYFKHLNRQFLNRVEEALIG